jgi:hypothetical protein
VVQPVTGGDVAGAREAAGVALEEGLRPEIAAALGLS